MSFHGCYAVIDAWQKVCRMRVGSGEWTVLLWLARQTDQRTMRVKRSQRLIAGELGFRESAWMDRQVRGHIKSWVKRGVLKVVEHGGGQGRKPAVYAIDLIALKVWADKTGAAYVPAPELSAKSVDSVPTVGPSSAVDPSTPYVLAPELNSGEMTSGVDTELRSFEAPTIANSGSGTYASSESSNIRTKEASARNSTTSGARSLALLPYGAARSRATIDGDEKARKIEKLLESGEITPEAIPTILRAYGVTESDVSDVTHAIERRGRIA